MDSSLVNEDIAPTPPERRTWSTYDIASLWIGMSVCIPTYMLASGLIAGGMSWRQAIFTIGLGNGRFGKRPLPASNEGIKAEIFTEPKQWLKDSQLFWGIQFSPSCQGPPRESVPEYRASMPCRVQVSAIATLPAVAAGKQPGIGERRAAGACPARSEPSCLLGCRPEVLRADWQA